ncbi:MAG: DEAD/DEAH box helicase family protein [Candidatus Woesearchaeota archaeon]
MNNLNELLKNVSIMGLLQNQKISENIINNIRFPLRDYQEETLKRFIYYNEDTLNPAIQQIKKIPTHLLFNLATGAGKTLLMACLILYYYEKGYRNFLFFVNQKNLVSKTIDNLCNSTSSKYLFKQSTLINGRKVRVKQVTSFNEMSDDIQIQFSTIQGLQKSIEEPRENTNTLENLTKQKVVMISDECHHLNASTKKLNKSELEDEKS